MEKGFYKFFSPETSAKWLKIPTGFTDYKNGTIPRKVSLRDRFGNMWPIGVINPGRDYYFQHGWKKFIEDNTVEFEDILVFDYDGKGTFDVKLLGRTGCEKKGVGGEKKENEMNVEHQKSVKPKRKNWACDSSNNSSDDDSDEDYMVEEEEEDEKYEVVVEEEDDEEEDEKEEEEEIEKSQRLRRRYVEEEEEDEDDEEEEETEEENEEENERAGTFKKNLSRSKAGCKKAATRKVKDHHGQFGADIFKSGRATQPKNPYFVANIRSNKRYHLNVPIDVVRDYKLELPERMTIRDSAGRKFKTEVEIWKDGRIWLIGGWRSLCGWNLVQKNDKGIFEFVRGKGNKGLYLQVQVLREGTSSHPNKKNKK